MIYSRFLHMEFQGSITSAQDETQYLIFSTSQSHTPSLGFRKSIGLQTICSSLEWRIRLKSNYHYRGSADCQDAFPN